MLPEPSESAPVVELGSGVDGELVLGEAVVVFGFWVGGVGTGVLDAVCCGRAFGLGVEAWTGARPGRYATLRFVPCSLPGRRMGAIHAAR